MNGRYPPVRHPQEANADHSVVAHLFHTAAPLIAGDVHRACYLASEWQVRQAFACLEAHNVAH